MEKRKNYTETVDISVQKSEKMQLLKIRSKNQIQDKQKTIINEKAFQKRTVCGKEIRA